MAASKGFITPINARMKPSPSTNRVPKKFCLMANRDSLDAMEEIKAQYETNLFGLIRVTQAVLPIMRKQKSGIIVNISSGAARFAIPGQSAYVSAKFAIEGLSESILYELEPFGIKVVLVEPGFVKTNIAKNMVIAKKSQDPNSPYSQLMENVVSSIEHGLETGSSPDVVANVVLKAVTSENPNLRYLAGKDIETWIELKEACLMKSSIK